MSADSEVEIQDPSQPAASRSCVARVGRRWQYTHIVHHEKRRPGLQPGLARS